MPVFLFDFDGTLADTAADLGAAANALRSARQLEPLPLHQLRPMASHGARGLIGVALQLTPTDPDFPAARDEFLQYYTNAICVHTHIFPDMQPVLAHLEAHHIRWGIVTNKHTRFTTPIVQALQLSQRAAVIVSGDTTPHAKPHPAPLLYAAAQMHVAPADCIYVGDDLRDIQAGQAAGMRTVAAAWGYCGQDNPPDTWGADYLMQQPKELLQLI